MKSNAASSAGRSSKPRLKLSAAALLVYGAFCLAALAVAILTLRF